jgi:hypothetical protein
MRPVNGRRIDRSRLSPSFACPRWTVVDELLIAFLLGSDVETFADRGWHRVAIESYL